MSERSAKEVVAEDTVNHAAGPRGREGLSGIPRIDDGGCTFAQAMTRASLVEEYRPVALGSGEPMCDNLPTGGGLEHVEATPYADGTVLSIHRRP